MIHTDPESFSTSVRGEGGLPDPETATDEKGEECKEHRTRGNNLEIEYGRTCMMTSC